jgi:hypothetical protein
MDIVSLLDINRQLVLQQDLDALLGLIVEHALGVAGAERGFLVLEEHGELRFDRALDSARGDIAHPEFEISGSVVREALQKMQPVRVSNAVEDPLLGHRTSVVSLELRSILCVPFEISRDLRGAIYVDHRLRKGAFDDRVERLCRLLADQAALAILQVKRMEEIRALNRELERRVVEKEVDLQNARRALREAGAPQPGTIVGQSAAILRVKELIARAAPSDLPSWCRARAAREGARGALAARAVAAPPRGVRLGELRGAARLAHRVRALRLPQGSVHGRRPPSHRPLRAGRRRHAVPGRDRRAAARSPGQVPARARDRRGAAPGRRPGAQGGLPARRRHEP